MLLVYTHKITPRLSYIFKLFFTRVLHIPVTFTTVVDEFVSHNGPKLTYSKLPLGNEFFIRSHSLLFEQGISDVDIIMSTWDEVPCFFSAKAKATLPFDVFAASFYLISRYEEYLPHVKDSYERFPASESLAYKNGFLNKPLVDIWAAKFLGLLKEKFPNYDFPVRKFEFISTINVDNVFAYKQKGIVRNTAGFIRDFFSFRFGKFVERFLVLLNLRKDPYDTFEEIVALSKEHNCKTIFFFLLSEYTTYDTNISPSNFVYKSLIKSIADYVDVGLLPSHFTMNNGVKLKKEKDRIEQIVNRPILKSRQHYVRMILPDTYQNLVELGVEEDYSMGYKDATGFRASTCTPFYFYDLDFEIQIPIKLFPFAVSDLALKNHFNYVPTIAKSKINKLIDEVKNVDGTFIMIFHNKTLAKKSHNQNWNQLYIDTISENS